MDKEINLLEVLNVVLYRKWIVIISIVLSAVIAFLYSTFLIQPTYTSVGTLYVRNVEKQLGTNVDIATITASQIMVNTCIEIMRSDTYTELVANDVDLGYTSREIRSMIGMAALNETEILQIAVSNGNPYHAAIILSSVLNNADKVIKDIIQAGSVSVLDDAKVPTSPTSPNIPRNTLVGGLLGAILSVLIIIAIHLFDVTVRDEEELTERYGLPVLGVIPTIKTERN